MRRGFTFLELITATTLAALLMTASVGLLRTSHSAWLAHDRDAGRSEQAYAVLRHIVRNVRQASRVVNVPSPKDPSGSLSVTNAHGKTVVWSHDKLTNQVRFGTLLPVGLLAESIEGLRFECFMKDGVTPTTDPALAQLIKCTVQYVLPHGTGELKTLSAYVWMRTW